MNKQKLVDGNKMKEVATYFIIQNTVHNWRLCIEEKIESTSLVKWPEFS